MKNTGMSGKICLVTGANSGIGKALAMKLAGYGAKIVLACRDRERGEKAMKEIKEITQNPDVELLIMDLSSQKSVRNGVLEIKSRYGKLDVLINNAGVLLFEKNQCEDGIEKTLATNLLGPFLLTNLLLESFRPFARIINVVSEGTTKGEIELGNLNSGKKYNPVLAYSQSKQAEILFTYELAERLKSTNITANCFYPGLVKTNLAMADRSLLKESLIRKVMTTLLKFMFVPLEESIKLRVFLAASGKAAEMNGKFLMCRKNKIIIKTSGDRATSQKLWEICRGLTGL